MSSAPSIPEKVRAIEGTGRVVARTDRRLGTLLADEGALERADIERVLRLQEKAKVRFGEAALRAGLVDEGRLRAALARQHDFPHLAPGEGEGSAELVVAYEPRHPRAEELRALRTQLLVRAAAPDAVPRALAIASPGPREGRSYLAANLAVVFAQLGERTLLIDADLRAPRQHRIFGVSDRVGLSTVLSGRAARADALTPLAQFGSLWLLPAGAPPPNPLELLSREAFADLVGVARNEFDVVLFDTAPAAAFADAQSVAFRAGAVLALARRDATRLEDMGVMARAFADAGARVVGTVLNAF